MQGRSLLEEGPGSENGQRRTLRGGNAMSDLEESGRAREAGQARGTGGRSIAGAVLMAGGAVMVVMGYLDPVPGKYVVLSGSGLIAFSAWLLQAPGRRLAYAAFALSAASIAAVAILWEVLNGLRGWWQLLLLPYLIGWLMDLAAVAYMLFRKERMVALVVWSFIAFLSVSLNFAGETSTTARRMIYGFNGSFESAPGGQPVNWYIRAGGGAASMDTGAAVDGQQSLKFEMNGSSHVNLFQTLRPAKAGQTYRVSFWLRNQGCAIHLTLRNEGNHDFIEPTEAELKDLAAHPPLDADIGAQGTPAAEWRKFEYLYTVPESDGTLRFEMNADGPGAFWIDDVRLDEIQAGA